MGKVKNHMEPITGLTQWIGRKLKNHDPLEGVVEGKGGKINKRVGVVASTRNQVLYTAPDGRKYMMTVEEVGSDFQAETIDVQTAGEAEWHD